MAKPKHITTAAELRRTSTDPAATLTDVHEALENIATRFSELHTDAGSGDLSASAQREWDSLEEIRSGLDAYRADLETAVGAELALRAQRVADSRERWGSLHLQPTAAERSVLPSEVSRMGRREARDAALSMLEDRSGTQHLRSDQLDQVDALLRGDRTDSFDGDWLARAALLTESDAYRSAWQQVMTRERPLLTNEETHALRAYEEFRAMSIGTDTSGGYGVPVFIDPTVILTAQGSANPFRRISRIEKITNDEWKGVSSAGVTWSYDAEGSTVSDDTPTLGQPTVTTAMARGFVPFSIEVGMDYPNFAEQMAILLGEGLDELQASTFATGSVSTNFRGILTALDANTNVEVVTTTDGTFSATDINKTWNALPDRFKGNATWLMSHAVGSDVATFGNSNNLSFVTVDLTAVVQTLRARPVEFSSYFPGSLATTGAANILVVGDFRNYVIAERVGMNVELVPHLFDVTNNRPTGQRGWFAWARHGGNTVNDLAFRLLQNQ